MVRATSLNLLQALVTNEQVRDLRALRLHQGWTGANQKACVNGLITEVAFPS